MIEHVLHSQVYRTFHAAAAVSKPQAETKLSVGQVLPFKGKDKAWSARITKIEGDGVHFTIIDKRETQTNMNGEQDSKPINEFNNLYFNK